MMKMQRFASVLAMVLGLWACSDHRNVTGPAPSPAAPEPNNLVAPKVAPADRISVGWVNQLIDGGSWPTAKDCGPVCELMVVGYLRQQTLGAMYLGEEKAWLARTYGDGRHRTADGYYTNTAQLVAMGRRFAGYGGTYEGAGGTLELLRTLVRTGRPPIVACRVGMNGSSKAVGHFVVVTGVSADTVWVNDPGRSLARDGKDVAYPATTFLTSWSTQGRSYVVMVR